MDSKLGLSIAIVFLSIVFCSGGETPRNLANGDGGPARKATLRGPTGLALDEGSLYVVESIGKRVRRVDLATGIITTIGGGGRHCLKNDEDASPKPGCFGWPQRIAVDSLGNVYITDAFIEGIVKVDAKSHSFSILMAGTIQLASDSARGKTAKLEWPAGIAVDLSRGLFFDDYTAHTVYRLAFGDDALQVVAGTGQEGFKGDAGPARDAEFRFPEGLARDKNGNLLIADYGNCRIQRVDSRTGIVTTLTGTEDGGTTCERLGDSGATSDQPTDVGLDQKGNVFFVQPWRDQVSMLDAATGTITAVAGDGTTGFSGDGGPATKAKLHEPEGVVVDKKGNLYIADYGNGRVRRVDLKTGIITTIAGEGPILREVIL